MNLNISEWKEFEFGKLISDIHKAKAINKDDLSVANDDDFSIRYVTRTGENNGCEMLADIRDIDNSIIEKGNAITIGDTTATCFYQEEQFITGDHMVVVRADDWLNKYTAMYILTILNNEQFKYSYGRAFLMDRIKETIVKLPVDSNDNPDWNFMSKFIKSLHHKSLTTTNKAGQTPDLNIQDWKRFYLGRLFDIKKGKRLTSDDQEDGENIYIGAIDSNNGVANHIGQQPIHEGNTISLSYNGSVGEAFYQPEPYWATDDVNALHSHYEGFNKYIGLFMAATIRQEKYRFSYGRKWTLENMKITDICLPIQHDSDNKPVIDRSHKYSDEGYIPDWQFMESYIKALPYGDRLER
ncbi:MAG: restriction endonuclease subunit S [Lachnospiraceae bacterium]|nr:restriction endonuclease subunit S [Lachnospiraceae bacterium]